MFFRREKPHQWNFEERLSDLRKLGFDVKMESDRARVTRNGCGAMIESTGNGDVKLDKVGVVVGGEIALLIHGGYQMFLRTPSGKELPALAPQLKALHAFEEDLLEGLGLTSLYNVALGTTCEDHLYDRVQDRDAATHPLRPWETKAAAGR
jgi:hypothetical protein